MRASLKKTIEKARDQEIETVELGYRVDGEVGRFEFTTHRVVKTTGCIYNSATDLFSALKGKEWYRTIGFKEIAIIYGDVVQSYRKTTELINRVRYQQTGGTPYRTLQANTETEGAKLIDYLDNKTSQILRRHQFAQNGSYQGDFSVFDSCKPAVLSQQQVQEALERISGKYASSDLIDNPVIVEDPTQSVNIAIDEVLVKKQSQTRCMEPADPDKKNKRKYNHNTVARIDQDQGWYSLVGSSILATLRYLLAFLLSNKRLGCRFQFFTDGHTTLNNAIVSFFQWYPNVGIILDWFHLVKKCKELLSMSLRGRIVRNELLRQVLPLLWYGLTKRAIEQLKQIETDKIKNNEKLSKLIDYLERNLEIIPCYALRKSLGLRNSSAIGEKMNDLIVSTRQKHKGMSWSKDGSLALAALTTVKLNREDQIWLKERKLSFKLAACF